MTDTKKSPVAEVPVKKFDTHVYAVVRVKVTGTNGISDDPQVVADTIAAGVIAQPDAWFEPRSGTIDTPLGIFNVEYAEFADELSWVLVDELPVSQDANAEIDDIKEYHFDGFGEPMNELGGLGYGSRTAKEGHLQALATDLCDTKVDELTPQQAVALIASLRERAAVILQRPQDKPVRDRERG